MAKLEIEIVDIKQVGTALKIKASCKFGTTIIGMDSGMLEKDEYSGEYKYITEVKRQMLNKFGKQVVKERSVLKEKWGEKVKVDVEI